MSTRCNADVQSPSRLAHTTTQRTAQPATQPATESATQPAAKSCNAAGGGLVSRCVGRGRGGGGGDGRWCVNPLDTVANWQARADSSDEALKAFPREGGCVGVPLRVREGVWSVR